MNILQLISGRTLNGALVNCKLLTLELASRGHKLVLVCRCGSWISTQFDDHPNVRVVESDFSRFPPRELKRVAKIINDEAIQVIHTHMSRANTYGLLLRMLTGVPVVATAHSSHFQVHWRYLDFVIANSAATENFHKRFNGVSANRIQTIRCFPDLEKFDGVRHRRLRMVRRQLRLTGDEFLVGVVGEVIPRKGQQYLFEALSDLVKRIPNLKIVMIGRFHRREAYTQKLRALLLKHRILRRVKWLGIRENIQEFMTVFDLCVVPSLAEPLGLVAIESMAAGTPVVATDVGGLPEIVNHEVNGLLVPPRDPEALADAMVRMASDHDFRVNCGENGWSFVRDEFAPDRLTRMIVGVYESLVVANRKAA